jgi:hypothetical protein
LFLSVRIFVWHPASELGVQLKKFCSQIPGTHAPLPGSQTGLGAWGNEHGTQIVLLHPFTGLSATHTWRVTSFGSGHIFSPMGHPFEPTSISGWLLQANSTPKAHTAPKTLFIERSPFLVLPVASVRIYSPASLGGCASAASPAAPSAALLEPVPPKGAPGLVAVAAATQAILVMSQIGNEGGQPWLLALLGGQ